MVLNTLKIFIIIFISFSLLGCSSKKGPLGTSFEPVQYSPECDTPFVVSCNNEKFKITPKATYKIYAQVVGKKAYSAGWEGCLSPYDLALAWGDVGDPKYRGFVLFTMGHRCVKAKIPGDRVFSDSYIKKHISNNHIIPANDNIKKAISEVQVGQNIYLEGYLVYIMGVHNLRTYTWNSSLNRTDRGDGACEVFYVNKVTLNYVDYQ